MQSAEAQARQQPVSTSSRTAKEVVTEFYSNYNAGNVDGIMGLMADNCEYHDMIYAEAFRGKREVRAFFDKAVATIPSDLKFRIDAISDHDPRFVGLKWHCDIDGHEFPFSRGCSFYEVNEQGLIVSGRDLVESAVKPGGAALQALRLLAPLVRMLGPNANPAKLKELPIAAGLVWAFYAGYMTYIMGNVGAPGDPIWATSAQTLKEVLHESLNFFYVNIFLNKVGITFIPDLAEHPTSEALFNFVNAWSMMFLPVMLSDKKGAGVKNKLPLWLGTQFLTNVFFVPYMALREVPNTTAVASSPTGDSQPGSSSSNGAPGASGTTLAASDSPVQPLPGWSPAIGWTAVAVGIASVAWFFVGRPEAGDLQQRVAYFVRIVTDSRVWYAFAVDSVLYAVFQAVLLADAPAKYRFVPFAGLAAYLIDGPKKQAQD